MLLKIDDVALELEVVVGTLSLIEGKEFSTNICGAIKISLAKNKPRYSAEEFRASTFFAKGTNVDDGAVTRALKPTVLFLKLVEEDGANARVRLNSQQNVPKKSVLEYFSEMEEVVAEFESSSGRTKLSSENWKVQFTSPSTKRSPSKKEVVDAGMRLMSESELMTSPALLKKEKSTEIFRANVL